MNGGPLAGLRIAQMIETDEPGGAERMVVECVRSFTALGAEVTLVLPADGDGWLARQLEGTSFHLVPWRLESPVALTPAIELANRLTAQRIQVVHSHEFTMSVYGAFAARHAGLPHMVTMHGGRYYAGRMRRRLAMRWAVGTSQACVAVSHTTADRLADDLWLPRSRITVIPNGTPELAHGAPPRLRQELGLAADDQLMVAVGSLYAVKGHRYLVAALATLAEAHPRLHLAIAGTGPQEQALRHEVQALGLTDRVHLVGLRDDIANVLGSADLFVLPSLSEGLPLALLEAMSAGCPAVASGVGDVPRVLANGAAGVLVPPRDVAALVEGVDRLLGSEELRTGLARRAQQRWKEVYHRDTMITRYARALKSLAERSRGRGGSPADRPRHAEHLTQV